jgi:DNA-binding Lrp family transcriptional regulator
MPRIRDAPDGDRPLDDLDRQILALLREDARLSLTAIGRELSLGVASVHDRLRRLQRGGYILGFFTRLNYAKLDLGLGAYVGLQTQQSTALRERLSERLLRMAEVEEFTWVTGEFDVLVRVRARDTTHLQQIIFRITQSGEGQIRARTMVILGQPMFKPGPEFEAIVASDREPPERPPWRSPTTG